MTREERRLERLRRQRHVVCQATKARWDFVSELGEAVAKLPRGAWSMAAQVVALKVLRGETLLRESGYVGVTLARHVGCLEAESWVTYLRYARQRMAGDAPWPVSLDLIVNATPGRLWPLPVGRYHAWAQRAWRGAGKPMGRYTNVERVSVYRRDKLQTREYRILRIYWTRTPRGTVALRLRGHGSSVVPWMRGRR